MGSVIGHSLLRDVLTTPLTITLPPARKEPPTMQPAAGEFRAQVLQATDIVELISQTVSLKRAGKDFKGLCPFHHEKTPSFQVSPSRQFYYCYGCKAGGNAIDFVMARDRVPFIEALRSLAERAHIPIPEYQGGGQRANERRLLLEAQSAAGAVFQQFLAHETLGKPARDYLEKRGFNAATIQQFQIGVAPDSWDSLLTHPSMRKFKPEDLAQAGLVKKRTQGEGYYDTFRNRLMFPIRDEQARIIAFGGRVMPGSQDPAKYLNSPETPLFVKSRCAFGIDFARQKIVETRTVAIVEGYTDTIMAHQFGASNVVSVLGTALTPQHVSLLRRFADRIVLLFDPDTAGELAVDRTVELFLTQPVEVAIATLPEALDPDEYLLKYGAEAFQKLLQDGAVDALSYKWKQLQSRYLENAQDLTGQQKAVEQYLNMLADARSVGPIDPLRWGSALARVSRLTDIPVDDLNKRFAGRRIASRRDAEAIPPSEQVPAVDPDTGELQTAPAPEPELPRPQLPLAQELAERHILGILLLHPRQWHDVQMKISPADFIDPLRQQLAQRYWDHQQHEGEPVFNEFLGMLDNPRLTATAVALAEECDKLQQQEEILSSSIRYILDCRDRRERARMTAQLKRQEEDDASAEDMLKQLTERAKHPDMRRGL